MAGPTHSPWYWDRIDELDRYVDQLPDVRDQRPVVEAELEPLIDTYWDRLDGC